MNRVERPARPGPRSRIVHIGLPKTGTSAVQRSMFAAREALAEHGVVSVARNHHPYRAARAAAGEPLPFLREEGERDWRQLSGDFARSVAPVTYLSAESLAGAPEERVRAIVEDLGGDLQVVVTLRALAPLLRSRWQASIIKGGRRSLENWLQVVLAPGASGLERWSVPAVLDRWGPVVGEDRLLFVVPDPADPEDLLRHFEALLGVPEHTLAPPDWDNRGMPFTVYEMLRQFNAAQAEQGVEDEVRAARLRHQVMRSVRAVPGLSAAPVPVPRWAAEEANTVAQGWIERLRHSSATVAGDVGALLVDPAPLPERVAQPASISVRDAGQLAHAMHRSGVVQADRDARAGEPRGEGLGLRDLSGLLRRRLARRSAR
ncbi:hypothetical protein KG112_02265 [Nocardioides sp. zg-ZUI104]|uniref:hypothetical protein n=1 Tax=Nocardioides faecalis TaxID=2803858 RepID=UPI001BCF1DC7|nr:hypothetical protein [Nocardioides faecalis]MBS4751631.1 hypothetical protein [Nocardioides faecalis]